MDMPSEHVISLLRYLDGKLEKYVGPSIVGSYMKLVRSRMRTKMTASTEIAKKVESLIIKCAEVRTTLLQKEKRLRESKSECAKLQKSLTAEKELRKSSEKICESLLSDIETTRKSTVNL